VAAVVHVVSVVPAVHEGAACMYSVGGGQRYGPQGGRQAQGLPAWLMRTCTYAYIGLSGAQAGWWGQLKEPRREAAEVHACRGWF
jgi:hypothetical protein